MLLDANQIREIAAIRKRQDGVYEMFSRVTNIKEDTKNIGDIQPQKTYYVDSFEEEATRENYWGGGSVLVTLGEPGSLEKVVEDLRKMLAEELK